MKNILNPKKLPWLALVLGVTAYVLRTLLYTFATDRKGLLVSHPLGIALGAVTVTALLLICAGVLRWEREPLCSIWPDSWGATTLITTLGFGFLLFDGGFADSRLLLVRNLLAVLAILSLILLFLLHRQGRQPHFLLYTALCLFFAVHLVSCYQSWSSNPQIQDYVFTLMANVGTMLYFYHKAAAQVGLCQERRMLAIGLLAAFFCFASLNLGSSVLQLSCGYWVLTDLAEVFGEKPSQEASQDPAGE